MKPKRKWLLLVLGLVIVLGRRLPDSDDRIELFSDDRNDHFVAQHSAYPTNAGQLRIY